MSALPVYIKSFPEYADNMGYITERAFVILLCFLCFFNSPLLFGRSGLQLRARIQLGFVEAFSTTLGFSHRLSQIDRCHFKHSVVNFVPPVYHNFAFLMNLFWFLPSGLLVFFCFLDARSLCFLYRAGYDCFIFLVQKFYVVASWMII